MVQMVKLWSAGFNGFNKDPSFDQKNRADNFNI